MANNKENMELESFLVTKHSWKGKYKRILSIGTTGISTYHPDRFDETNRWPYSDVLGAAPNRTSGNTAWEFTLSLRKEKKQDTIKLSSEFRNEILTAIFRFYKEFSEKPKFVQKYQAKKHHWSGISLPIVLEVTPCSLDQLDPTTNTVLASYNYKDIDGIIGIQDYEGGIVLAYGGWSRLHLFKVINHYEVIQNIVQYAQQFLAIDIKVLKSQITLEQFENERFGKYKDDQYHTSMSEFIVQKISIRHCEPVRRILCLTDYTLLERDPQTYSICTLRPLNDVFALIRDNDNIQQFSIEYKNGSVRTYITNERDSLLATLLDAVRSSDNPDVHVRINRTPRGKRAGPLTTPVDEETETNLLKFIISMYQYPVKRFEIMERFNANVPYSGLNYSVTQDSLFSENKERLITGALQALTTKELDLSQLNDQELEGSFHVLRRLLASKVGFAAFTNLPGFRESIGQRVVTSLRRKDLAVSYAAIDMINSLMHSMHADYDLKQEQLNKSSLLHSKSFLENLLEMWVTHINLGSGALILSAMLDFLTFALCAPYSETTDGKQFDLLLNMVAERGRSLFKLFQHSSLAIVKGAGLVMRALIEEGDSEIARQMQILALDEAALCKHLLMALYTPSTDATMATHRQLSRQLVGLWVTDSDEALNLFNRIFPAGLLMFLESENDVPKDEVEEDRLNTRDNLQMAVEHSTRNKRIQYLIEKHLDGIKHWGLTLLDRTDKITPTAAPAKARPVVLRNRRKRKQQSDKIFNLPLFFYQFGKSHTLPNLIWNHKTREELRIALENEIRQFQSDKELAGQLLVAWNYDEFEVQYNCLADEIKIGDYYIRILLERDDWPSNLVKNPNELFNALYRRVLCRNRVNDDQLTVSSLQALAKVYNRYFEEIGYFSDMPYILQMIDRCLSPSLRDALVTLVKVLVLYKANCRPVADHVGTLVDLLTLAHLHRNRVAPNTKTNTIEAGLNMKEYEEKDWYYNIERENEKPERIGPVTFSELKELWVKSVINPRTRCWATGMDGWRSLQQIPQLKWCLMAKGNPLYNESELAKLILDILIKCTSFFRSRSNDGHAVLIPGPRMSRKLSEFLYLPQIVQLCLTHDPALVERVATLLCQIMEDNSEMSKIYLTGVFYFMLMYTGSNILPVARFLKLTHMKQAFRNDDQTMLSNIMYRSILGQLLPEAMVCFLENYSAEKFAEIFLGEFDTPEVIWNSEMRRMLIEKISAHIADFTPRLRGHCMSRYPYIAIPVISYPQLENELFCHIFYLRHLTDTQKFPNWPIAEPVLLLKHTLDAWRKEVEKRPPEMTVKQAYEVLGIDLEKVANPDESLIRKSYYKLAQIYHPDKNPKGREIFVRVNQAYEFICSRTKWSCDGPSASNIVLILRTQSILFERYSEELRPYKYAGYPQLIKTIRLETKDDQLFSKPVPLLSAASELCYHTVNCSALNAEELRREEGIEALLEAYSRCVSIMGVDSKPHELHYQVISNITKCFEVACYFENCKNKILQLPRLLLDVCHVVSFKHSPSVALITSLAANNTELQNQLVCNGILWSVLLFMFEYDYTLDESGVAVDENTNQQQACNNLAKLGVNACCALSGYSIKLLNDPTEALSSPTTSQASLTENSPRKLPPPPPPPTSTVGNSQMGSDYSEKATNIIQQNQALANIITSSNREERKSEEDISTSSNKMSLKYSITGIATNKVVKRILDVLLTPFISNKLATESDNEVLKTITSNARNPYLIWDNGTRAELLDFLEQQRTISARQQYEDVTDVLKLVSDFSYESHKSEVQVGNVFLRIYNEMPTFPIENPKLFVIDLLVFLKQAFIFMSNGRTTSIVSSGGDILVPTLAVDHPSNKQIGANPLLNEYQRAKMKNQIQAQETQANVFHFQNTATTVTAIIMVMKSLIAVINANPNIEMQCIGYFDLLFQLLCQNMTEYDHVIKQLALEIISLVSRNKDCVGEIAACDILGSYLTSLKDPDLKNVTQKVLDTLSGLVNMQRMVKEAQAKGAVIYLLDHFCNSNNPQIRETCAELLGKMTLDKLSGPKVRISVCKFLPVVFLDAMIETPAGCVQMFESTHEHPELIWNDKSRETVSYAVRTMADNFYMKQKQNPKFLWHDPEQLPEIVSEELIVSGVYLRLFVSNPGWTLRKPKQFLSDLLDFIVDNISRTSVDKEALEVATQSLVLLLNVQPNLADAIPVLGHIPKFFRQLSTQPKSALEVLHALALSEVCVAAIAQTDCIYALKKCMEENKNMWGKVSDTLSRLFKCQHDSLVRQSLESNLVQYLLTILDSRIESEENPAMIKAKIVAALKSMTHNINYGDRVAHILNTNKVWADYRDQKHDLFIMDTNRPYAITAGVPQSAGYLTQAPSKNVEVSMSPPPIDRDDPMARPTDLV